MYYNTIQISKNSTCELHVRTQIGYAKQVEFQMYKISLIIITTTTYTWESLNRFKNHKLVRTLSKKLANNLSISTCSFVKIGICVDNGFYSMLAALFCSVKGLCKVQRFPKKFPKRHGLKKTYRTNRAAMGT